MALSTRYLVVAAQTLRTGPPVVSKVLSTWTTMARILPLNPEFWAWVLTSEGLVVQAALSAAAVFLKKSTGVPEPVQSCPSSLVTAVRAAVERMGQLPVSKPLMYVLPPAVRS
jgi:hypothetical protein